MATHNNPANKGCLKSLHPGTEHTGTLLSRGSQTVGAEREDVYRQERHMATWNLETIKRGKLSNDGVCCAVAMKITPSENVR